MSALSDREAAASPLVAIHEQLSELWIALDAVVTEFLADDADEQAHAEAVATILKLRVAAAKIRGHAVAGDAGEWFARKRAEALNQPFISTDRRARHEKVIVEGQRVPTDRIIGPDGTVVGYDD